MQVSLSGQSLTFQMVRRLSVVVIIIFVLLAYLYGPAASPAMRNQAVAECNNHAEGNWRSFRLNWNVGVYPHWTCWDASKPMKKAVSLGWWTNPFQS